MAALKNDPDLIIRPADKNLGMVILTRAAYSAACNELLSNTDNYKLDTLDISDRLHRTQQTTASCIAKLLAGIVDRKVKIPKNLCKQTDHYDNFKLYLQTTMHSAKIPQFTGLIKLHKMPSLHAKPVLRPIALAHTAANAHLSKVIAALIHPVMVQAYPWIIQDSLQVIRDLDTRMFSPDTIFVTGDIVGMYTNLSIANLIHRTVKFCKDTELMHPTVSAPIVSAIFKDSMVQFEGKVYLQSHGIPMGNPLSPDCANLYCAACEVTPRGRTDLTQPSYMGRLIDDYILIFENSTRENVDNFLHLIDESLGHDLTVEWNVNMESVDFLDLRLSKGPAMLQGLNGTLSLNVHQKTLNNYMYLPVGSGHHHNVHRAWIRAELIRYVTHSSLCSDYMNIVHTFTSRLAARGINTDFIKSVVNSVSYSDRQRYLYPQRSSSTQPLALIIPYDASTASLPVSAILRNEIESLVRTNRSFTDLFYTRDGKLRYLTAWKKGRNLGSLLCKEQDGSQRQPPNGGAVG